MHQKINKSKGKFFQGSQLGKKTVGWVKDFSRREFYLKIEASSCRNASQSHTLMVTSIL